MISSRDALLSEKPIETDLDQVGATVFRPAESGSLGICVPARLVIAAPARRCFREARGLGEQVVAALNGLDPHDNASTALFSSRIRADRILFVDDQPRNASDACRAGMRTVPSHIRNVARSITRIRLEFALAELLADEVLHVRS